MRYFVLSFLSLFILASCQRSGKLIENESVGYAQGTTYQIKYLTAQPATYQESFDSIFAAIDQSMSTYRDSSVISRVNRGDSDVVVDEYFRQVFSRSLEIAEETGGYFDPSVGPLVRIWGFSESKPQPTEVRPQVDSTLKYTGYKKLGLKGNRVLMPAGFEIDFNAIAQGYTVDVLAGFLERQGVENYMVEVGGELRTHGVNSKGKAWLIGIDKPADEINEEARFQVIVALQNSSLATSGNYRKFWVDQETGLRYSHTIDPHTGMPARNSLLSVSVLAPNSMDADAYATACMAMGLDKAWEFVNNKVGLEAYFVSAAEGEGWMVRMTEGFEVAVVSENEK